MPSFRRSLIPALSSAMLLATLSVALTSPAAAQTSHDNWVGTWATSPVGFKNASGSFGDPTSTGTTLREIVHVSIGGSTVRVILSNEFGVEPLTIGSAQVALRASDSAITPGSAAPLTFSGRASVVIPPGALVVSDAAPLALAPLSDVAVSLYVPVQPLTELTRHGAGYQTNYSVPGDAVTSASLTDPKTGFGWDFLKGVDVKSDSNDSGAIVAFGDSITDGALSTRDKNARWPNVLAERLAANKKTEHIGVLNEGIGGNRILHDVTGPSALSRFDRDVLAQSGVKYLIIMESINDIGHATDPVKPYDVVSVDDLTAGITQMARRAHTHGIKVIAATLTPYVGAHYYSPAGEVMRQAVNQWIRTTKEVDGVIDFEKAVRDPANASVFLPAYDSGDHLHPKDAGYKAMGDAIDLKLFAK